jgi:hypothetical protein
MNFRIIKLELKTIISSLPMEPKKNEITILKEQITNSIPNHLNNGRYMKNVRLLLSVLAPFCISYVAFKAEKCNEISAFNFVLYPT